MALFTIFGGSGFIGRHLANALKASGQPVSTPQRDTPVESLGAMGHVIYCAGLTADFRSRPHDTMEAHVGLVSRILAFGEFDSLVYLSSTRIYDGAANGSEEMTFSVDPWSPNDLYNISKLAGESLCLNHANPRVRVARLSNVYGTGMYAPDGGEQNFLCSVIRDAISNHHVELNSAPGSAKDYIHIGDVVQALALIAIDGKERIYNVASGDTVSHEQLLDRLSEITGCTWSTAPDSPHVGFPKIATARISAAFAGAGLSWSPSRLLDRLPDLTYAAGSGAPMTEGAFG
ncbi:MAG: nucleoside-diphosphate-sugar epimerase [Paracoccaceae bacterium]|jgi:nucleoside-diphosphate-sugar epimerase